MFKSILKFISLFIFFILSGSQVYAACVVNGTPYKTNDGTGTKVNRTQMRAWSSGDVTSCDVTDTSLNDMSELFADKTSFNQDLSAWNVSAVTDMSSMFNRATSLTSVSLQDTSSVLNMFHMIGGAKRLLYWGTVTVTAEFNAKKPL